MPGIGKRNNRGKRNAPKQQPVTRRQFLKEASLVVGGAAIASLTFAAACSLPEKTIASQTTSTTNGTSVTTTISTTPVIPENTITPVTSATPTVTENLTTTTSATSTWSGAYAPPLDRPNLLPIPGCETRVADDRLYAAEHMWVKAIAGNIVVIGITEKFLAFLEVVFFITLLDEGSEIHKDLFLGSVEASKMNVELVSPVSGTILQNNDALREDVDGTINASPYSKGWMQVIQLSKPEELNDLLTPEKYVSINAKIVVE